MRWLAVAICIASCSPAFAESYYAPVKIVKDAFFCTSYEEFLMRERMVAEKRSEGLQSQATLDVFRPTGTGTKCGAIPAGKYMFFEGFRNRSYVCLRPRPGSECWWMKRENIGEIFELFPGRTLETGNKGVTCDQWAKAITQAKQSLENDRKTILGPRMNPAERFAQGMTSELLRPFAGNPTLAQQTRSDLCHFSYRIMQTQVRQLKAFDYCPQLDTGGLRQEALGEYQAAIRQINGSCVSY